MIRQPQFTFRLFVAGDAPHSVRAVANLTAICLDRLADRYQLEIVDVFREPKRALAEGIFMTPTLVALTPLPVRRIVGTLSQTQTVLLTLGLLDRAA